MTNPNVTKRLSFLTGLLKTNNFSIDDIKKIKKAFDFANLKHGTQLRKSGEPYIIHPLETAIFLAEWKMDTDTIITGLLHDVLEDTECSKKEIQDKFGNTVGELVEAVTKVSKLSEQNRAKQTYDAENSQYVIKVIMSISNDVRAVMVKIADRMHNMQTINHLRREKQLRIANETFNIYANIAGRLGLYHQKTKLLDLCFSIQEPEKYNDIKSQIDKLLDDNRDSLNQIKSQIESLLKKNDIKFEIFERVKGIYSTYKKIEKGIHLSNIHDIFAIRIVGDYSELKCYEILGLIHINFTFLPQTFKDYISSPKLNLYQSLHTTITYRRIMLEVQIRNNDMDMTANYGVAAHWLYKESDTSEVTNNLMYDIFDVKEMEVSKKIKNIQKTRIYDVLLMNNNKWYVVVENSTVLDLAFRYDPKKILYLKNVFREGVPIPLSYSPIKDDVITLEYSDRILATKEWENYTTLEETKKIFANLDPKVSKNAELLVKMKEEINENIESPREIKKRLKFLNFDSLDEYLNFYTKDNLVDKDIVYEYLSKNKKWKKHYIELLTIKEKSNLYKYNLKDIKGINYKKAIFTDCCSKIPGMNVVGVITKGNLMIHKFDCEKIKDNSKKYVIEWDMEKVKEFNRTYSVKLEITFLKIKSKINPIIHLITSKGIEIEYLKTFDIPSKKEKVADFHLLVNDLTTLNRIISDLKFKFDEITSIKIK